MSLLYRAVRVIAIGFVPATQKEVKATFVVGGLVVSELTKCGRCFVRGGAWWKAVEAFCRCRFFFRGESVYEEFYQEENVD